MEDRYIFDYLLTQSPKSLSMLLTVLYLNIHHYLGSKNNSIISQDIKLFNNFIAIIIPKIMVCVIIDNKIVATKYSYFDDNIYNPHLQDKSCYQITYDYYKEKIDNIKTIRKNISDLIPKINYYVNNKQNTLEDLREIFRSSINISISDKVLKFLSDFCRAGRYSENTNKDDLLDMIVAHW